MSKCNKRPKEKKRSSDPDPNPRIFSKCQNADGPQMLEMQVNHAMQKHKAKGDKMGKEGNQDGAITGQEMHPGSGSSS